MQKIMTIVLSMALAFLAPIVAYREVLVQSCFFYILFLLPKRKLLISVTEDDKQVPTPIDGFTSEAELTKKAVTGELDLRKCLYFFRYRVPTARLKMRILSSLHFFENCRVKFALFSFGRDVRLVAAAGAHCVTTISWRAVISEPSESPQVNLSSAACKALLITIIQPMVDGRSPRPCNW